jgi:prepilin-type processing-associated H-X9-DG protein
MELIGGGDVWQNFQVMSNELNTPKILFCPEETDRERVMATTFAATIPASMTGQIPFTNNNNVSYFIGVDADQTQPQMLLSGDDGFTVGGKKPKPGLLQLWTNGPVAWNPKRHAGQGNVLLADGSVVGTSGKLFFGSGTATNCLLMP